MKQQSILTAFSVPPRKCIAVGSHHQGELENGGQQCTCVVLVYLASCVVSEVSTDIDNFLQLGTNLFSSINNGQALLINELPRELEIENYEVKVDYREPRSGILSQTVDNNAQLSFEIGSALEKCLNESMTCFLTIGNNPAITVGIMMETKNKINVMDSHSRDRRGLCCPDGKAVIIQVNSTTSLVAYIKDMMKTVSSVPDLPFEVTPVSFIKQAEREHTLEHGDKRCAPDSVEEDEPSNSNSSTNKRQRLHEGPTPSNPEHHASSSFEDGISCASEILDMEVITDLAPPSNDNIDTTSALEGGMSSCLDISDYSRVNATDEMKAALIQNRIPDSSFKYPPKQYKDIRRKSGMMSRSCCNDWLHKFEFLSYSKKTDGLYCLACVLFPDTSHRRAKKMITEPYKNWKDALHDSKNHAVYDYHADSMARLKAFKSTFNNPSIRVDLTIRDDNTERIKRNREILTSLLKCLEFCGRQGISLRGHRDDGNPLENNNDSSFNKGNFKSLIKLRVDAGDKTLENHLQTCKRNSLYTSKTAQNDLLKCIKDFIQESIVADVRNQTDGAHFGFQCDEVSDSSNWEQLGIVIRYIKDNRPVEKLIEFVPCECITGEAICQHIIDCLHKLRLDPSMCRAMTMDGAGNMAGRQNGCAARFNQQYPKAVHHYCSSHDLNLALCKSCKVKEVHIMLDSIKQLGIFFKYSPKRSRKLEKVIEEINENRRTEDKISKSKFSLFCETRWSQKHTTLTDFNVMYEAFISCLDAISTRESNWDAKAVGDAYGLTKRITDPTFIAAFQTVLYFFGHTQGLSKKLQGSSIDIVGGFAMVDNVKKVLSDARSDGTVFGEIFKKMESMATIAGLSSLSPPRLCGRQTQRNNVPADTPFVYFKRAIFLPYLDSLLQQFDLRFTHLSSQANQALCLLPSNVLTRTNSNAEEAILAFYKDDLPSCDTFQQEIRLWRQMWQGSEEKPATISDTLANDKTCGIMFPNIRKILSLLLLTSVSAAGVERANSALKFVKTSFRSTMGEDRFNALVLLFVHKDIKLDFEKIIDKYAQRNPRRMILFNPLSLSLSD